MPKSASFRLKLHGEKPFSAASVGTIISRSADVCTYIGHERDVMLRVEIGRISSGSLEILFLLAEGIKDGNPLAQLAFDLIAANIVSAFALMRLATGRDGRPRPLPGPAASAMADVLDAVEQEPAIEGWSVGIGKDKKVYRSRAELFDMRGALGGPKDTTFLHKVHIEVQSQTPGFPTPFWQIKWEQGPAWDTASVAAPIDGVSSVAQYDKLVVDLEIQELMSKGAAAPREVFVRKVYWSEGTKRPTT